MMDSGQNDIHYGLEYMIEEEVKKSIPNIISQFTVAVVVSSAVTTEVCLLRVSNMKLQDIFVQPLI